MTRIDGTTGPTNYIEMPETINRFNIFERRDNMGVSKDGSVNQQNPLSPPLLGGKPEMMKVMAAFEDLIILMSKLAKETQVAERESELAALATKITQLLSAAKEKEKGADKMMAMAVVSLVISVVSATISAIGSGLQLGGAIKGGAAAAKTTDSLKELNKSLPKDMQIGKMAIMEQASNAFTRSADKLSKGGMLVDSIGKGIGSGANFASTQGQALNQRAMASADRMQAEAEADGIEAQRSQQMQQDMRDLLSKMVELLNSFYAAQDKISSAAAH